MKHLTEKEIREHFKDYSYVKECNAYELIDFVKGQLDRKVGEVNSIKRHIDKDLVWNDNGRIRVSGCHSKDHYKELIHVDIKIGGLLAQDMNKALKESVVKTLSTFDGDIEKLKNILDSLMIIYVKSIT